MVNIGFGRFFHFFMVKIGLPKIMYVDIYYKYINNYNSVTD